jgi:hypothetical protein
MGATASEERIMTIKPQRVKNLRGRTLEYVVEAAGVRSPAYDRVAS